MPTIDLSQNDNLIPSGQYRAEAVEVKDRVSRKNEDMLEITWRLLNGATAGTEIRDFIVFNTSREGKKRVRCLLAALGKPVPDGTVTVEAADVQNATVLLNVVQREDRDGDLENSVAFKGYEYDNQIPF